MQAVPRELPRVDPADAVRCRRRRAVLLIPGIALPAAEMGAPGLGASVSAADVSEGMEPLSQEITGCRRSRGRRSHAPCRVRAQPRAAGSGYHPSGRILILDGYRAVLVAICQKEARSAVRLSVLLATERRAPGNS